MNNILRHLVIVSLAAFTAVPQAKTTIRQIDFDNFNYPWSVAIPPEDANLPWHWLSSAPNQYFRAVNGTHHFRQSDQDPYVRQHSPLISVESVSYGDLDGDGMEEAVVTLNYSTGGTANWDYLYVYRLERGKTRLLARMQTGSRGYGGLVRTFVDDDRLLVIDLADPKRRVGDCCSDGYIRVRYRWHEAGFTAVGTEERGDLELHEGPPRPKFRDYAAKNIYRGKPAKPIITGDSRMFRTMIRLGADSPVEFAGHYTVPRWGCGSGCNGFAIVDSVTGKIYDGFSVADLSTSWLDKHGGYDSLERMEFHPNSRLMKINACPNEKNCGFYDYEMVEGKGLKLIRKELLLEDSQ